MKPTKDELQIQSGRKAQVGQMLQILSLVSDGPVRLKIMTSLYAEFLDMVDVLAPNYTDQQRTKLFVLLRAANKELEDAPENYAMTQQSADGHVSIGPFLLNLQRAEISLRQVASVGGLASYETSAYDALFSAKIVQEDDGVTIKTDMPAEEKGRKFRYKGER